MFQEIIHRVQHSVDSLINKYVSRVVVAVPFVVAAGFGTAAASNKLSEVYGSTESHTIMAIAFAVLGSIAAAVIAVGSRSTADDVATEAEEPAPATQEAQSSQGAASAELALTALGALGPSALTSVLRILARNLPLVVGVVVVAYLLLSETPREREATEPAE